MYGNGFFSVQAKATIQKFVEARPLGECITGGVGAGHQPTILS